MKIGVLRGGISEEREVSLKTGAAVINALKALGHEVVDIDPGRPSFVEEVRDAGADFIFIALHGKAGEDGTIQSLLELLDLPYNGSGPLASAMAFHKGFAKKIFSVEKISTADYTLIKNTDPYDAEKVTQQVLDQLQLPLVVKPARQGSTIGITIAKTVNQLNEGIGLALSFDDEVVVERFIPGTEVTVSLLGNDDIRVLPLIEIVSEKETYDYEAKYTPGMSHHIIPPRLSPGQIQLASEVALSAHRALGCCGLSRSEVIVNDAGAYILEVNTLPGMTETSLFPDAARAAGLTFSQLISRIIDLGLDQHRTRRSKILAPR